MRIFRKVTNTHRGMVTNQLDYFSETFDILTKE